VLHNIYYWQGTNETVNAARQRIDQYVAVARPPKDYAVKFIGIPAEKIQIIPHALRRNGLYRPYRSFLARRASSSEFRIVCVSNYYPQKNLICLIKAFSRLENRRATLVLIGKPADREYFAAMQSAIAESTIEDRIRLAGSLDRSEISRELSLGNMFVFPSLYEGFGLAALEAVYFGLPIVVSNTGYADHFLDERQTNGVKVEIALDFEHLNGDQISEISFSPPNTSIEALRAAMQQVIDNYDHYLEAAANCAEKIPNCDLPGVANRYIDLVNSWKKSTNNRQ
jgi:glycosyltransferase involved in cell wall biosynthesis